MKRILFAFAAAALMFVGCTKELEQRVDQLEQDVTELQSGLDALKAAVEKKLTVEDYNQIEDGYELVMSDGTKLYIYNGADGAKGDKGDKGETGPQGPQGEKGDKGDAFFQSVELSEDGAFIVITLVDGTVYELPLASNFNILFTLSETKVLAGETYKVPYQIVGAAESDEVVVRILSASNCEAVVVPAEKVVSVTPAQGAGYVDLYALNNTTGELKAKTISFNGEDVFEVGATTYYVSPAGGDVEVPVTTSVDYEIEIDGAWLAYAETKAVREETVVLSAAAANTSANDNVATVTMKNAEGKVLATFTVTQKNYYPEWVADEAGEPVEWAESFELYRYEDLSGDATAKTGVFTFELTDDPAKGAFKVVNMFNADLYFNNGQMVAGQGGVYYADVEGDVLTVYRAASVLSYGFTDDVTVAYNASEKTFAIADPVYAYNYGTSRDAYIANYAAAVKTDAPAGGEGDLAKFAGTWNETYEYNPGWGSWTKIESTFTVSVADDKLLFEGMFLVPDSISYMGDQTGKYYGTLSADGTTITLEDATSSGHGMWMSLAYHNPSSIVLNVAGNTLTVDKAYSGSVNNYVATNPDMEVGGEEPAAFAEKVWSIAVPFGGGQDRNLAMDSEYIYVAQSAGGNGVIKAYSIADGSYVKDVKVKTHTPAGLDNGTHAISCVRMLPNTDSSVNGGKDVLVASNLTTGDGTEKLIVYVWSNGVDADPDYFVIDSGVRRLGDKFTVKGTYQKGELLFFDYADGGLVIRVNMANGVAGLWPKDGLYYATGRYAMPVAGASNIGECTIHPDTDFDADGNPTAALLTTNAVNGFFTQNAGNAYVASAWGTDPNLTQTFGYNFFSHNDKDYVAYVKVAGDRNSATLNVIEDVNGAADFKGTLEAKTGLFTAPVEGTGNAGHGVGDCATAVADGVRYIVVMGQNIGISLYKLN